MDLNKAGLTLMTLSAILVIGCTAFVFSMEQSVEIPLLVLGHGMTVVSALGVKIGYIMHLEAKARLKR